MFLCLDSNVQEVTKDNNLARKISGRVEYFILVGLFSILRRSIGII